MTPHLFRYVRPLLAILVVVLSFGFLFYICVFPVPEQNKDIIQIIAGLVIGVLVSVSNYYYGNSKDKSDQEQSVRQGTTTTATVVTTPPDPPQPQQ